MSASKMELYSLFWNTAAIAGPVLLEKPLSSKVYRFYCAEDDRHARNYELELHKISLRSVCSLPCTSQYRTNGCMCFRDAAEISPQRSRISCCGPTYQHLVNFAMCSLQSFAALYANVRIWEVVFYKKFVAIPCLTTREGQPDGGYLGVITLTLLATSPHPQLLSSEHH